jgi:hypothetical protein
MSTRLALGVNQIGEGRPPADGAVHVIVPAVPDDDRKRRRL